MTNEFNGANLKELSCKYNISKTWVRRIIKRQIKLKTKA